MRERDPDDTSFARRFWWLYSVGIGALLWWLIQVMR